MTGEAERCVEENVVHVTVPFPEFPIEIMITVISTRTVEVNKISAEQACHQDDTAEARQLSCTSWAHCFRQ